MTTTLQNHAHQYGSEAVSIPQWIPRMTIGTRTPHTLSEFGSAFSCMHSTVCGVTMLACRGNTWKQDLATLVLSSCLAHLLVQNQPQVFAWASGYARNTRFRVLPHMSLSLQSDPALIHVYFIQAGGNASARGGCGVAHIS